MCVNEMIVLQSALTIQLTVKLKVDAANFTMEHNKRVMLYTMI